jgi:hypothetical protein
MFKEGGFQVAIGAPMLFPPMYFSMVKWHLVVRIAVKQMDNMPHARSANRLHKYLL